MLLPFHIAAGVAALFAGYLAIWGTKGGTLHRLSGMVFVVAMVTMSLSGAVMDALKTWSPSINVVAGLMTFYFVVTGLLTVRRRQLSWLDRGAVLFALTVAVLAFSAGVDLAGRGRPEAVPSFIFGTVGVLAAVGDIGMMRAGGLQGPPRIKRHLWRMCFAMWVAAASFFWGPPTRVPEMIRIPALTAVAVLIPIFAMGYWLWRLRSRKSARGLVPSSAMRAFVLSEHAKGEL
jgi:uncharacterized membrane protein